jgi:hypothetical protein
MRICELLVKPLYQTLFPDFLLHFLKQWKDSNHDIGYHSTGIANKKKANSILVQTATSLVGKLHITLAYPCIGKHL